MLAGELYLSADPELVAERLRARQLVREYNATAPEETARRTALLAGLFGRLGVPVEIEPPFHCDYGYNIDAGAGLYMNVGCVVLDCAAVTIGSNVLCGPYVQIYTAYHPIDPEVRRHGPRAGQAGGHRRRRLAGRRRHRLPRRQHRRRHHHRRRQRRHPRHSAARAGRRQPLPGAAADRREG